MSDKFKVVIYGLTAIMAFLAYYSVRPDFVGLLISSVLVAVAVSPARHVEKGNLVDKPHAIIALLLVLWLYLSMRNL